MKCKNKKTNLIFWLVLAILLTIGSILSVRIDKYIYKNSAPEAIGQKIISHLNLDKIFFINLKYPDGSSADLKRDGSNWVVLNLYNYPADLEKVNKLLEKMYSSRIIQNVILDSDTKKQLDLLRNGKKLNNGTEVLLYDNRHRKVADLVVGKKRTEEASPGKMIQLGRYIFIPGSNKIVFTDSLFNIVSYRKNEWLNKTFPKIEKIKSIESFDNKKLLWRIERTVEKGIFTLNEDSKKNGKDLNGTERMVSSLNNMTFNSIASPKLKPNETGLNSPKEIKVITFDKKMFILKIGKKIDNEYYLKIFYYPDMNKVKDLNKKYKKWIYLIDSKRIDPLLISKIELLKKLQKAENEKFNMPIG